jgi:predicted PurR-regulated permease PerM
VTRTVVTFVVGVVTITFTTFFMLVEGPAWLERLYGLMPARSQARWRAIGHDIYRTVGGYVTGNCRSASSRAWPPRSSCTRSTCT